CWYSTPAGQSHDRVQKQDVRRLLRPAKPHERLLDVGCGTGHWSRFFGSLDYEVHGIDIAPEMLAVAHTAVPGCAFDVADACDLPFEDGAFDVVASMALLEFISDPAAVVREMARCTRPGGSLLIGTLNRLAPLNQHRLSKGRQPYSSAHLLTPKELREMLQPYGKVRMAASPVARREKRSPLAKVLPQWCNSLRRSLSGAFIVAEVRT
ncbi:MAG: class I SAM-dependent methyltransferase, partial [Phycisphaerae bacterium]|nr:class I SAM-dependent methyltransferase [Phycisphaerae bacterium]